MDIALARLANQGISNLAFDTPDAVVAWLGALQAQDYLGALWTIGLRMRDATERAIEQAVAERTIVRTWPMRGTLHFVSAQDVRWMLALLTPRIIAQTAGRYRQLELDETTFARSKAIFRKALEGGQQLTRDEMQQQLEQANISPAGQRGYHILVRCAQDGLLCFGTPRGKQQTFTLLDEWVLPTRSLARDEALAELTKRYFVSHGPATLQDLMRWAGLTMADGKIGLAAASKALIQETIAGQVYWLSPATPTPKQERSTVHLLPGFDEYLLGYGDRSAVLDPAYTQRICPGGNGIFAPTLVIDGQVTGTWKRTLKKGGVLIEVAPFRSLTPAEVQALANLGNFHWASF
jgi:hypothetical protein